MFGAPMSSRSSSLKPQAGLPVKSFRQHVLRYLSLALPHQAIFLPLTGISRSGSSVMCCDKNPADLFIGYRGECVFISFSDGRPHMPKKYNTRIKPLEESGFYAVEVRNISQLRTVLSNMDIPLCAVWEDQDWYVLP